MINLTGVTAILAATKTVLSYHFKPLLLQADNRSNVRQRTCTLHSYHIAQQHSNHNCPISDEFNNCSNNYSNNNNKNNECRSLWIHGPPRQSYRGQDYRYNDNSCNLVACSRPVRNMAEMRSAEQFIEATIHDHDKSLLIRHLCCRFIFSNSWF